MSQIPPEILDRLQAKFDRDKGELSRNLEGLYHSTGVKYWDYIHLDTLQTLQHRRTNEDDELIFIVYHQITELYFLLIKSELLKLTDPTRGEYLRKECWLRRIGRVVNNIEKLTGSFDVLSPDPEDESKNYFDSTEFLRFRTALMPASGFQSVSLREIELMSTGLHNLLQPSLRDQLADENDMGVLYQNLYWKAGGRLQNGNKPATFHEMTSSRTLEEFEKKYDQHLLAMANEYSTLNLEYRLFHWISADKDTEATMQKLRQDPEIRALLSKFSFKLNQEWKGWHFEVIKRHMNNLEHGTGGTNWKEFLPPGKQILNFFPSINSGI